MDPTGGALTVAVASLNSWTLEMNRDRVDVTASTLGALQA